MPAGAGDVTACGGWLTTPSSTARHRPSYGRPALLGEVGESLVGHRISGGSQYGAVVDRTTALFLKLFGLSALADLPEAAQWDPTPEEQADLRERLLRVGDMRAGRGSEAGQGDLVDASAGADDGVEGSEDSRTAGVAAIADRT